MRSSSSTRSTATLRLGTRRGWLLLVQFCLVLAILGTSLSRPESDPWTTALGALFIAFFSASQDVVVDALRVESLRETDQGWGAALTQWGYRLGMVVSTFVENFQWSIVAALGLAAVLIGNVLVLRPAKNR